MRGRGEDKSGRLGTAHGGLSLISPRNSKSEIRNKFKIRNSKSETAEIVYRLLRKMVPKIFTNCVLSSINR